MVCNKNLQYQVGSNKIKKPEKLKFPLAVLVYALEVGILDDIKFKKIHLRSMNCCFLQKNLIKVNFLFYNG